MPHKSHPEKSYSKQYLKQVSDAETEIILSLAKSALDRKVEGDFCEFGCFRGDTSILIEKLLESYYKQTNSADNTDRKHLWIYDSFEGLPQKTQEDESAAGDNFQKGALLVTKKEVVERFKKAGLKVPRIRKNFFENLDASATSNDLPAKIAFAFLDGDLYQSIKTSLELISPRLAENSIVVVHDYNNSQLPGVTKAVEEWMYKKLSLHLDRRESLAIINISK